jgi:hypothetical protein
MRFAVEDRSSLTPRAPQVAGSSPSSSLAAEGGLGPSLLMPASAYIALLRPCRLVHGLGRKGHGGALAGAAGAADR